MRTFTIRPATPADAETIVRIQRAAVEQEWRSIIGEKFDAFLAERFNPSAQLEKYRARAADPALVLQVVEDNGTILGYGGARPQEAEDVPPGYGWQASAFYLDPAVTGRGASTALWNGIVEELKARGGDSLAAWCLAGNAPARRFYEKRGGRLVEGVETPAQYAQAAPHVVYGWKF